MPPRAAARVGSLVLAFGIAGVRSPRGAGVAKPVNAEISHISGRKPLRVRVPSPAPRLAATIDSADEGHDVSIHVRDLRVADFATPRRAGARYALRLFACHPASLPTPWPPLPSGEGEPGCYPINPFRESTTCRTRSVAPLIGPLNRLPRLQSRLPTAPEALASTDAAGRSTLASPSAPIPIPPKSMVATSGNRADRRRRYLALGRLGRSGRRQSRIHADSHSTPAAYPPTTSLK